MEVSAPVGSDTVCVVGMGMVTSVGFGVAAAAAAVRARIGWFCKDERVRGYSIQSTLSLIPGLEGEGARRLPDLVDLALEEALSPLRAGPKPTARSPRVHVCLACAAPRPSDHPVSPNELLGRIAARAPETARTASLAIQAGHASGLIALAHARKLLCDQPDAFVLAGGADSYCDGRTLRWLDGERRLLSKDNPDGFVPGEAAAFCLVTTMANAGRTGMRPLAVLRVCGTATEPSPLGSERPCLGRGLTHAIREALTAAGPEPVTAVLCDLNGESFRTSEWAYAYMRTARMLAPRPALLHPADRWGDIGAASGPALVCLATRALQRSGGRCGPALVFTSSDGAERAAVVVQAAMS